MLKKKKRIRRAKSRERKPSEYYKSIIRKLRAQLDDANEELRLLREPKIIKEPKTPTCSHCGKGNLIEIDIIGRIFYKCDICNYKIKK